MIKSFLKSIARTLLDALAQFILAIIAFRARTSDVIILTDYLGVTELTRDLHEKNIKYSICCTHRFPFRSLLRNYAFLSFTGLLKVKDYGPESVLHITKYCKKKDVSVALIQAGTFMVPAYNSINNALANGRDNSDFASECSLNKQTFRERLNEENIGVLKSRCLSERSNDLSDIGFPCVIKPAIGTASEGVLLVSDEQQLDSLITSARVKAKKTEFETTFFVEEYIDGPQFDVEGIICDGELYILCIVQENYEGFLPEFNYNWYLFNPDISPELEERIYLSVAQMLTSLEIRNGAFHTEFRIRPCGEIIFLDFANRMGGGFEALISECTGTNFASIYVDWMVSKKHPRIINKRHKTFIKYLKDSQEEVVWDDFLRGCGVEFSLLENRYRGTIKKIICKNISVSHLTKISEEFNISFYDGKSDE